MTTAARQPSSTISADMDLSHLAERMAPNGEPFPAPHQVRAMRAQLVADAPTYGWRTCADVEDVDWFRMLDSAMKATA